MPQAIRAPLAWGMRKTLKEHTGGYSHDLIKVASVPRGLRPRP